MSTDLLARGGDLVERADVCVIGSGGGGAVAAAVLARGGRSVVVLEQGHHWTRNDFTQREEDMLQLAVENGVKLVGLANFEGRVSKHATQVLAANFANMIEHFWNEEEKTMPIDLEDEIQKGCIITHGGNIVHERFTG